MHACNIMHRDLKSDNILVTKKNQCKVADFGVSRIFKQFASTATFSLPSSPILSEFSQVGTLSWMAPESPLFYFYLFFYFIYFFIFLFFYLFLLFLFNFNLFFDFIYYLFYLLIIFILFIILIIYLNKFFIHFFISFYLFFSFTNWKLKEYN